jgi:lipoprotein-anchoring transpeptidase ErfK/SrfK
MHTKLADIFNFSSARAVRSAGVALVMTAAPLWATQASAQVVALTLDQNATSAVNHAFQNASVSEDPGATAGIPARLRRQVVDYPSTEPSGTVIVDTPNAYLYFVLGGGKAIRYGIGVGRDGFTWSGTKTIERKSEWPDWLPPADMLARQPYLPRFMAGGPGNPLGARAMYISGTVYRIHGTNKPSSIGQHVSSGCIRMLNEDVIDLYNRTRIGTKVVVLPMNRQHVAQATVRPTPMPTSIVATREVPSLH